MTDGLLLSEFYLRKGLVDMELMEEGLREDLFQSFRLSGKLVEGVTYSDSKVLPLNS